MRDLISCVMDADPGIQSNLRQEMSRIYNLPDLWLAAELLRLARGARSEAPDILGNPYSDLREAMMVWRVIPELATRLGALKVQPNERGYHSSAKMHGLDYRQAVGANIRHAKLRGIARMAPSLTGLTPLQILSNPVAQGNPLGIALDRLAPPQDLFDPADYVAAETWCAAFRIYGVGVSRWSPDLFPEDLQNPRFSRMRFAG